MGARNRHASVRASAKPTDKHTPAVFDSLEDIRAGLRTEITRNPFVPRDYSGTTLGILRVCDVRRFPYFDL